MFTDKMSNIDCIVEMIGENKKYSLGRGGVTISMIPDTTSYYNAGHKSGLYVENVKGVKIYPADPDRGVKQCIYVESVGDNYAGCYSVYDDIVSYTITVKKRISVGPPPNESNGTQFEVSSSSQLYGSIR